MIVDVHTHVWEYPAHIDESFAVELRRASGGAKTELTVDPDAYLKAIEPCDHVICFGLRGLQSGLHVPNEYVASFVARAPRKLIGFMSLDPNEALWMDDFEHSWQDLNLKGVKLGPIYAAFDPTDPKLNRLYTQCTQNNLPVLFHVGTSFVQFGPLEWTRPLLIDAIARRFPDLKIVMAHLGHPWENETIVVIRKHPNVYADISALYYRPWQFYHALMLAQEYHVLHKLLFGSDYPFATPTSSLAGLRNVNQFCAGTNLPRVNEEAIEEIIHRNAIKLLWD